MDYNGIYNKLMERSFNRKLEGYVEKHHINPRCRGGSNRKSNIAILTPEEHFLAHQLLVKIYPKDNKLIYAANMMCSNAAFTVRNNKQYKWLKIRASKARTGISVNGGSSNGMFGKTGSKHHNSIKVYQYDINHCFIAEYESITDAMKQTGINNTCIGMCLDGKQQATGGYLWYREKIEDGLEPPDLTKTSWNKGKHLSKEMKEKLRNANLGKVLSDETKSKISKSSKGEKNHNFGKRGKEVAVSRPVIQYTKNGDFISMFDSIADASRQLNISRPSISATLARKTKSAGGFVWEYADAQNNT